ncbi:MAG: DUF4845 domain-containing protein [Burkholderiales bacterium]|nr:DUF4845 domain-containing protein [Burkholderiales bacterium]
MNIDFGREERMKILTRSLRQQRGIGFIGLVFIFAVAAVILLLGLKLVPVYLELFSVKKVMAAMAQGEEVRSGTVTDIRKSFDRRAVIDNIQAVTAADLEITKDGGETVVVATWQHKVALFTGYTLLVDFSVSTKDG